MRRPSSALRAGLSRARFRRDHVVVDRRPSRTALALRVPEDPLGVRVVLGEQEGRARPRSRATARRVSRARPRSPRAPADRAGAQRRPLGRRNVPRPRVAIPERRQQVERRPPRGRDCVAVMRIEDVVGRGTSRTRPTTSKYRSSSKTPVSISSNSGARRPRRRFSADERVVGKRRLRVLVEVLHVRVGRRGVEVEVVLLHVLAVIALDAGQPEEALLQDRIAAVPERQREAEPCVVVADAGDPVLAPAVGARAGVIVGK